MPTNNDCKALRRANLAYAQFDSSSDSDVQEESSKLEKEIPLPPVARNVRKVRENSDDEDDIPLAELQQHLRNNAKSQGQSISSEIKSSESENNQSGSESCSDPNLSSDKDMIVDTIGKNKRLRKSRTSKNKSVKTL